MKTTPPNQLTHAQVSDLAAQYTTPFYAYNRTWLSARSQELLDLSLPFGLTVRYAVKANPHADILHLFTRKGLHFDVSSSYEAELLLKLGIAGNKISLSSQQPAHNLAQLLDAGVQYVASSMHQLVLYSKVAPRGSHVALRVNAGMGSGHNNRTKTAGTSASFGLWHEYVEEALLFAHQHGLVIDRLHTHIGSGADASMWEAAIDISLAIAARMPNVTTLDMGGGYKVQRVEGESETDMRQVAADFTERLVAFKNATGRSLHLEIEPGTWLVAHAGCLVTEIVDIVDTGKDGFTFLRTNTGMNDFMRPTLYGAQHKMHVLNSSTEQASYVVVGHNCESGDILTPAPGDPEVIAPRTMNKAAIGDLLLIEDTGAYCASLRAKGYNAFPDAQEVMYELVGDQLIVDKPARLVLPKLGVGSGTL